MPQKQKTIYGFIGLLTGILGGIAGAAFSMGAGQQQIRDNLAVNTSAIAEVKLQQEQQDANLEKDMDRHTRNIENQIAKIQEGISRLTTTVGDLKTEVLVLKALMERMEQDLRAEPSG